jgi:hypothetical protein
VQAARAISLVKRAVNAAPPVARYRHSLGLLLEKSGQLDAAADALEAACGKDKGSIKVSCLGGPTVLLCTGPVYRLFTNKQIWSWHGASPATGNLLHLCQHDHDPCLACALQQACSPLPSCWSTPSCFAPALHPPGHDCSTAWTMPGSSKPLTVPPVPPRCTAPYVPPWTRVTRVPPTRRPAPGAWRGGMTWQQQPSSEEGGRKGGGGGGQGRAGQCLASVGCGVL